MKTVYGGVRFDSKREAQVAQELDLLRHAQDQHERVFSVERQFRIPLIVNDVKVADYICDFFVTYADGRKELLEVKSKATMTPVFRLKMKILQATWLKDHPDITLRITK